MDSLGDHFPAGNAIASQFVGHDLPRFALVASYQPPKKAPGSSSISASLKVYIHHIPILVHSPPQIVLLAADLYEDRINVNCVAIALMSAFQSTSVFGSKLDAPESDGLVAHCDTTFSQ